MTLCLPVHLLTLRILLGILVSLLVSDEFLARGSAPARSSANECSRIGSSSLSPASFFSLYYFPLFVQFHVILLEIYVMICETHVMCVFRPGRRAQLRRILREHRSLRCLQYVFICLCKSVLLRAIYFYVWNWTELIRQYFVFYSYLSTLDPALENSIVQRDRKR